MSDWEERNGALTGTDIHDEQGGWDPWWFTPTKKNTHDPNQAIVWKCDTGKIFRSTDCGVTWVDVSPDISDPPNSWSWVTAPTVADLTFLQRVDSIHQNGLHIFLAEMQDPLSAEWGGWLLQTDDDGATGSWTWETLKSDAAPLGASIATCNILGTKSTLTLLSNALTVGQWYITRGSGGPWYRNNVAPLSQWACWCYSLSDAAAHAHSGALGLITSLGMQLTNPGWATSMTSSDLDGTYAQLLWLAHTNDVYAQVAEYAGYGDNSGDMDVDLYNASPALTEIRPIWADLDTEDGSILWLTLWSDDVLYLEKRDTSDLSLSGIYTLGACTAAELAAGTYVAYPFTPTFDQDTVYVHGRMQNPQGLGNPSHLIRTVDGGANFTLIEGGWGADVMNCFRAEGDTGGARLFHAIRNLNAGGSQFYYGSESLTYRSATPFGSRGVNVDAMSIGADGQVAIGADAAGAIMIGETTDAGGTWTDITGSYPATGAVKSLTYV